jgi:hypothetical protein
VCPGLVYSFDLYIHYIGLGITKPHADVAGGKGVRWSGGLTCVFWAENAKNNCGLVQVKENKGNKSAINTLANPNSSSYRRPEIGTQSNQDGGSRRKPTDRLRTIAHSNPAALMPDILSRSPAECKGDYLVSQGDYCQ